MRGLMATSSCSSALSNPRIYCMRFVCTNDNNHQLVAHRLGRPDRTHSIQQQHNPTRRRLIGPNGKRTYSIVSVSLCRLEAHRSVALGDSVPSNRVSPRFYVFFQQRHFLHELTFTSIVDHAHLHLHRKRFVTILV